MYYIHLKVRQGGYCCDCVFVSLRHDFVVCAACTLNAWQAQMHQHSVSPLPKISLAQGRVICRSDQAKLHGSDSTFKGGPPSTSNCTADCMAHDQHCLHDTWAYPDSTQHSKTTTTTTCMPPNVLPTCTAPNPEPAQSYSQAVAHPIIPAQPPSNQPKSYKHLKNRHFLKQGQSYRRSGGY